MKIVHLTTHLNSGGITKYLTTLSKGLIERGHQVVIASSGGNEEDVCRQFRIELLALNIRTKSELDFRIYTALPQLKKFIKQNNIQLIHAHTRITQVMAQLLSRSLHIPYVSTCHGFFKTRFFRRVFPCWGDRVIAISEAVRTHLTDDFHVAQEKVRFIPHGIDIREFDMLDQMKRVVLRKKYGLTDEVVIGIIARLSDVKGVDILIQALPEVLGKFSKAKLVIVGRGREEENLKNLVSKLGLQSAVKFIEQTGNTNEFLNLFDLFIMPSRQEGLGLAVMEAQAAGLAVVASNVGGLPSLIKHQETGWLVEKENISQLAQTIIQCLNDPAMLRRVGMQARAFITQEHSLAQMVDKTVQVYKELIKDER